MKSRLAFRSEWAVCISLLLVLFFIFHPRPAHAGLTMQMNLVHYNYGDNYYYYFNPYLTTNATPPSVPYGTYYVTPPGFPTNGSTALFQYDTNGFNEVGGGDAGYYYFDAPDFGSSFIKNLTNGVWSILVTNTVTTNVYHFSVTANIDSNSLPPVVVLFPPNGSVGITNDPTFEWEGPADYSQLVTYEYNNSPYQPTATTNWNSGVILPDGPNSVTIHYYSNSTTAVICSTPLDSFNHPISSWVSTDQLETYFDSQFSVGYADTAGTPHTLVAHFPFDATSGSVLAAAVDTSGNGYNMSFGGGQGSQGGANMTSDAAAGIGAVQFHDGDGNSAGYLGWSQPTPAALLSALAGSFSVSCWVKTTQNIAGNTDPAYYGAGIVSADNSGLANDVIPMALTGGSIAFNTGGNEDDTLNSITSVNDGNYHHVVVTRNQLTGQKIIYIDGLFDSFAGGTTNVLTDPQKLTLGALANAGNPDPNDGSYYNGYDGELDDLQIYSGVLSAGDAANLFANPGTTITNGDTAGNGGHTNIAYYSFEDDNLFAQDFSGNNNGIQGYGNGPYLTNDAAAGSFAVGFRGADWLTPPTNLVTTLAGSFSVSLWAKTTADPGNDSDTGDSGAGILAANPDQVIPLAQTGSKLAFLTGGSRPDTLHSTTSINTGHYVHLVVTRDQDSGEKRIYINGSLDSADVGAAGFLTTASGPAINLGIDLNNFVGFTGELDEVQVYSGVLSPTEVSYLYSHPGTNVADVSAGNFNAALNTIGLNWATSGDSAWSVEGYDTLDGLAAQSGPVTNYQISTLSVTVTGPGTLTFNWSCSENDPDGGLDYEFYVDDPNSGDIADIYGTTPWQSVQQSTGGSPINIPPGQHTLGWMVSSGADTNSPYGYLDQVTYTPGNGPSITLNPFNQTNYPGYPAWLNAAAAGNPAPAWQWYESGSGVIPGATNSYYTPTNSGTSGVAGQYYAVASNTSGSAMTTTATVSFVSAPLPPDWSIAFKSMFNSADEEVVTKDYYYGCVVDTNGNIYAAAEFGGPMTVGTQNLVSGSGGDAAAVVKQTAAGQPLWAAGITNNGAGSAYGEDVALAPAGGVYLSGNFTGTNWLGTNQLTDNGGGDIFVSRFDASGSNLWLRTFGSTNGDFTLINSLASDASGNVTLSGLFSGGPVTIGSNHYNVTGQQGILIQLDATGAVRWSQLLSSGFVQYINFSAGRLYVALNTSVSGGTTNVVIGGTSNITDRAWALACLDANTGNAIWVQGVGARNGSSQGNPYGSGLIDDVPRVAANGTNVFITGVAYDTNAVFGAFTVNFSLPRGQYVARYDTNGNPQLATGYGSVTTSPVAAAADAKGDLYVSGDYDTYSFFGKDMIAGPSLPKYGAGDFSQAFLAKFDVNGNTLWAREATATSIVNFLGIALASDGIWASGWCQPSNFTTFQPTTFGTNRVNSDPLVLGGIAGGSIYIIDYPAGVLAKVTDTTPVASPVTLVNAKYVSANLQFSFQSQTGFMHSVLYRTNLVAGAGWQTYSNVIGDDTLKTIPIPLSLFSPSREGFIKVSTQ
jgi:hypothetical protein